MTCIKLCGLSRTQDIEAANRLKPDYVGFVLWPRSRRAVTWDQAAALRGLLDSAIPAVGVFVDEDPRTVARLLKEGVIQIAQLHGHEEETDLTALRALAPGAVIWKAFSIRTQEDIRRALSCSADRILLDNGCGTGEAFDWALLGELERPFILAGGLTPETIPDAIARFHPEVLDLSSGIETGGVKDPQKMARAVVAARSL